MNAISDLDLNTLRQREPIHDGRVIERFRSIKPR